MSNKGNPVYGKVYDEIKVKSSISTKRAYLVRLGEVTWDDDIGTVLAIYVCIEYEGTPQIYYRSIIPHFLVEPDENKESDFSKVYKAMGEIAQRNNLI